MSGRATCTASALSQLEQITMTHDDESVFDKAKDAIGMDDDDRTDAATDEPTGSWAGVDDALGGTGNLPAGSIYGGGDTEDEVSGDSRREDQP